MTTPWKKEKAYRCLREAGDHIEERQHRNEEY
jgi:hypothetical protein